MDIRYFITEVYIPSGSRTIEHQLAAVARKYVDHILSHAAMLRLADEIKAEMDSICETNKRLKPVEISFNLDGDSFVGGSGYRWFRAGQVSVHFRLVQGELI